MLRPSDNDEIEAAIIAYCAATAAQQDRTSLTTGPHRQFQAAVTEVERGNVLRGYIFGGGRADAPKVLEITVDAPDRATCRVSWSCVYEPSTRQPPVADIRPAPTPAELAAGLPFVRPPGALSQIELTRVEGRWLVSDVQSPGRGWRSGAVCLHAEVRCPARYVGLECLAVSLNPPPQELPDPPDEPNKSRYIWRVRNLSRRPFWLTQTATVEVRVDAGASWVMFTSLPTRHGLIPGSLVTKPDFLAFLRPGRRTKVHFQTIVPYGHAELGARGRW